MFGERSEEVGGRGGVARKRTAYTTETEWRKGVHRRKVFEV